MGAASLGWDLWANGSREHNDLTMVLNVDGC